MRSAVIAIVIAALSLVLPGGAVAYDERTAIVDTAYSKLGAPFRLGTEGPDRFDCSGFVWWVYSTAGLADEIGDTRRLARGYHRWFRDRGLLYTNPNLAARADLVFYAKPGKRVSHMGIVTSFNRRGIPKVTSALINPYGVTETRYDRVSLPVEAFAAVPLGEGPDDPPDPEPEPEPTPTPTPTATPTPTPEPTPTPAAAGDAIDEWLASGEAEQLLIEAMTDGTTDARTILDRMAAAR